VAKLEANEARDAVKTCAAIALKNLSHGDLTALYRFAADNGRYWRAKLVEKWDGSFDASSEAAGFYRRMRNVFGPSMLAKVKLAPVVLDAAKRAPEEFPFPSELGASQLRGADADGKRETRKRKLAQVVELMERTEHDVPTIRTGEQAFTLLALGETWAAWGERRTTLGACVGFHFTKGNGLIVHVKPASTSSIIVNVPLRF
jgi:hypothetical protein